MMWQRIIFYIIAAVAAFVMAVILYHIVRAVIRFIQWIRQRKATTLSANDKWLVDEFSRCNVIVFGKKGSGKDLLFAHVIALRKDRHYANIPYNGLTDVIRLEDVSLTPNTFEDCINGTIKRQAPRFEDGKDIYISDGGIYLASQYDPQLNKLYPSMPIFYALSRHLYNNNIHVNAQNLGRIWLKLRDQAECYIRVTGTVDKGDYLLVSVVTYDNYRAASLGLLPSQNEQFVATNGEIVARRFRVYKAELEYDTRYFRDVFIERELTPWEQVQQRLADFTLTKRG